MDSSNNEGNYGEKGVDDLCVDSACAVAAIQKTHASLFQELCTKFDFGMPMYDLIGESGEAHKKSFRISLTVWILGISGMFTFINNSFFFKCGTLKIIKWILFVLVVGKANTKMQAKHDAACKMMMQLKKTAQIGGVLNTVTEENLMKCLEWFVKFIVNE